MKHISISLYNRPIYTNILFEKLEQCYGIDDYHILVISEPTNSEVIHLAKNFVGRRANRSLLVNKNKLGCNKNIFNCLNSSFEKTDFNIHFEDDTIPGKDCLRYFEWANEKFKQNTSIFNISAYQKDAGINIENIKIRNHFTPWGWATWKNRWDLIKNKLKKNIVTIGNVSWDQLLLNITKSNEIYPEVSRTQNIGADQGTNVPNKEWHAIHQYNAHWIDSIGKYADSFNLEEV
jgi:hypothetical protein